MPYFAPDRREGEELAATVREALRFVERAKIVLQQHTRAAEMCDGYWVRGADRAAVRRASLDLTRSLAHLWRRRS